MDKEKIGKKLIELRGDIRREAVANAVGISVSSLTMYELGLRVPRDPVKEALAQFYKKKVSDIFFN